MWRFASLLGVATLAMSAASACEAQRATPEVHDVAPVASSTPALMLGAARAGVAPSFAPTLSLQHTSSFAADTGETGKDRGARALVGGVIGALIGAVVGTAIDYQLNRKTLNDRNAEKITVHVFGFLLPPVGAITGAIAGWHS